MENLINILNEYDKTYYIRKKINKFSSYSININSDEELDVILLYDENNNLINKYKFEIIGSYEIQTHIWTWAWNMIGLKTKTTNIAKNLFDYGYYIDLKNNELIKKSLITSSFEINSEIQLEINIALACYLTKNYNIIELYNIDYSSKTEKQNNNKKNKFMKYFICVRE